jgi:DNA topoisomerase-1
MESSDDEPIKNKKKAKKVKADPDKQKKRKRVEPDEAPSSSAANAKKAKTKELKKLDKAERLQYAMQAFLWWNAKDPPEGCQWETMEHAGVSFPEPYQPHGVKMNYDGQAVELTPLQEEA